MASTELLKMAHSVDTKVTGVDDRVKAVDDRVQDVGNDIRGDVQDVGDRKSTRLNSSHSLSSRMPSSA